MISDGLFVSPSKAVSLVVELAQIYGVSKQRVRWLLARGRIRGAEKNPETGLWERSRYAISNSVIPGKRGPKLGLLSEVKPLKLVSSV